MTREEIQSNLTNLIHKDKDLIILVSIRIGKTKIALDAIEDGDEVLVVYPVAPIKEGWDEDLIKFPPKSNNINFSTSQSIKKWANKEVDYLILDEPQLYSPAQIKHIKTIKFRKKRVGLTGTLKKSTESKLLNELRLPVRVRYTLENAIEDKLVKDYKVYIHYNDLNNSIGNILYSKYGRETSGTEEEIYKYYVSEMDKADKKLEEGKEEAGKWRAIYMKYQGLLTNFIYNSPTLFLTAREILNSDGHIKKTLIYSMRSDIALNLSLGNSYTSDNRNEELFERFKTSESGLMGVVNCVQAGVTFHHLDKVVFHSAESNTEKFQQKLGRSLLYDYDGNYSEIHVCCLKDTIQERWVKLACTSLNQNKIVHIYNGKEYNFIEWAKLHNPGKKLYLYSKTGGLVYLTDPSKPQEQYSYYCFIGSTAQYQLDKDKLIEV